jgi:peptide/nickel transport system substrate-binding protein
MKKRNKIIGAVAMAASVALAMSSCAGGGGSEEATDTIRTTIDIPATFDPTMTMSLPDYVLARTSYDTLVRKDASGLVPGLASEWTTTPTQAVFTIRDGATCSDGTVITPTIVKNSLDYYARPDNTNLSKIQAFGISTPVITADDSAGTVTIDLDAPWTSMIDGLSIASSGIICPAGLADPEGLAAGTVKGSESGPYVLSSFEPGVSYSYTLRDDYKMWPEWTSEVPGTPAKNLQYVVSPDPTATSNLVIDGQMDIGKIQAQNMDRFKGLEGYNVAVNRFSDFYIIFNEREGSPFTDPAIRLGVAQALDRVTFEKVTSLGTGEILTSLAASTIPCVPGDNKLIPAQNVEAAKKVLTGVKIRFIGPNIAGPAGAGNEYIAESLRAAGADVTIENTDVGTWISTIFGQPDAWDLTMFADLNFLGSLTSPLTLFVGPSVSEGGGNLGSVNNPVTNESFGKSLVATSVEEQCAALNDAVNALIKDTNTVPLINDAFIYAQRPGFSVQMLGGSLDDPIFRIVK